AAPSLRPAFSDTKPVTKNNVVADSECEEIADICRDLLRMGLEREVAGFEEMDHGTGNIAPERLSTARQEKGIVLSPDRQETWLVSPEVILERRVKRNIALVVAQQVQLNFVGAGAGQIEVVERIAVRRNRGRVRHAVHVLPAR